MPDARSTSRTSTARTPSTGSSTRAAAARSGCAPTSPRRSPTPTTSRWPRSARRACATTSARDPVYGASAMQRRAGAGSYLGVPLELSDGARVGALAALRAQARPLPARRRAALHDARARARLRARARVQRARPAPAQRLAARPRARDGRASAAWSRVLAGGEDAPPRRLPRRVRDGGRAGRVPARAVGPRVRLDGDERRRDGAGDDPAARRTRRAARSRRARATSSPTRARTRRSPSRWSTRRPRARRCSSRCCATARSPAC